MSDLQAAKIAGAVNRQVNEDFLPFYGGRCHVNYDARPEWADWTIFLRNESTVEDAAGHHTFNDDGRTSGEVALDQPFPVSAVVSHEVLEMLGNRSVADIAINYSTPDDRVLWAKEVCDPVQADLYKVDEFPVSAFVTPYWFSQDFRGHKTTFGTKRNDIEPFEIADGGWAIAWTQDFRDRTLTMRDGNLMTVPRGESMILDHERAAWLRSLHRP